MRLNELLGIEFPFIQGGMANIATAEFAAAVSNAGALGLIGAGGMSPEVFQDSIRRCRTPRTGPCHGPGTCSPAFPTLSPSRNLHGTDP